MQPRQGVPIARLPAAASDFGLSSKEQFHRTRVEDSGVVGNATLDSDTDLHNCDKRVERIPKTFVLDDGDEAEYEYFPDYIIEQRDFFIPVFSDGEVDDIIDVFCQKCLERPEDGLPLAGSVSASSCAFSPVAEEAGPSVLPGGESDSVSVRCGRNRARRRRRRLLVMISSLAVKPEHERTIADRDMMMKRLVDAIGPSGAFGSLQQFIDALTGFVASNRRHSTARNPP